MASSVILVPSLIYLDEEGKARIVGTRFKVDQIARWTNSGQSANQIMDDHPGLALEQIYSALAYYFGNRGAIDRQIALEDEEYARLRDTATSSFADRMRSEGHLT